MAMTDRSIVAGVFTDDSQAQQAMKDLQNAGFSDDQIRYSVHRGGSGILDSLIGLGLGEDEANYYNNEFMNGRTIVTVKTNDRQQEAMDILRRYGEYDFSSQGQASGTTYAQTSGTEYAQAPQSGYSDQGEQKAQLREEIDLGKRTVQEGQQVTDTVGREEAHVNRSGDVN